MLGAAHKPGAIALRPLGLGDIYDGAFRIIRFNPRATVGSALLVASVTMAIPVLVTALLTFTVGAVVEETGSTAGSELLGAIGSVGSLLVGLALLQVGLIFVTGMIAHVTHAAAVGRRLGLGEAWAATRGKRWRLLGLTLLINLVWIGALLVYVLLWFVLAVTTSEVLVLVIWGILSVPAFLALMCWFWVRIYYLPAPALMLEDVGVLGAIGRGWALTRGQFWRTFGIALLTVVVASIAGNMLAVPVTLAGQLGAVVAGPEYAALGLVLSQALASVISSAFVAPFTASVASLQYLDQRMRKEAYDVELMTQAGVLDR